MLNKPLLRFLRTSTFRLALLYMVLFGVSVIALLGFIYASTTQTMQSQIDEQIELELNSFIASKRDVNADRIMASISKRLAWSRVEGWVYLLADDNFQKITGNLRSWPARAVRSGKWMNFELEPMLEGMEDSEQERFRARDSVSARALIYTLPGGQVLLVGRDMREIESFKRTMGQALVWAVAMIVLMGTGGGFFMSRVLLRRIDLINRAAERIMKGGLSVRMPVLNTGDEFDRLSETLNAMLSAIQRLMHSIQGVTTNLAHDLRSPLTRMKSKMEVALLQQKPEQHRDALEYAIAESDELLATFNALLSIADAEGGKARENMGPVDLFALCLDATDLYAPVAEEKNLALEFLESDNVIVHGHRQLLFQALSNLIDNAIKYTPEGGRISVAVKAHHNEARLMVADTGPGIPEHERARVLERFVRLDESRTTRGNGLGLSLVAAIAHLHEAGLQLSDTENEQGLCVTIVFPYVQKS